MTWPLVDTVVVSFFGMAIVRLQLGKTWVRYSVLLRAQADTFSTAHGIVAESRPDISG
jgi:hypothetical protein